MKEKTMNLLAPLINGSVRKRFLFVSAIATTVMIAAAFLVPQGVAKIPLDVRYMIGERMVYYTTEAIAVQEINTTTGEVEPNEYLNTNPSLNYTEIVEVVDFDGETYTLNHSQAIKTAGPGATPISFVEKMNKTGFSTWIFPQAPNVVSSNRSGVSNPALTGLLARSEVTVGDTWVIPVTSNSSNANTTGNMTLKFIGIQDITVPAGTYKVFRVDTASDDTVITLSLRRSNTTTLTSTLNMTVSGQTYIEYDTGRQIERNMHIRGTVQTSSTANTESGLNYTAPTTMTLLEDITVQTQLIESIMPTEGPTPSPSPSFTASPSSEASPSPTPLPSAQLPTSSGPPMFDIDVVYAYVGPGNSSSHSHFGMTVNPQTLYPSVVYLNFTRVSNVETEPCDAKFEIYLIQIFSDTGTAESYAYCEGTNCNPSLVTIPDPNPALNTLIDTGPKSGIGVGSVFSFNWTVEKSHWNTIGSYGSFRSEESGLGLYSGGQPNAIFVSVRRIGWIKFTGTSASATRALADDTVIVQVKLEKYADGFLYNKIVPEDRLSQIDLFRPIT